MQNKETKYNISSYNYDKFSVYFSFLIPILDELII